MTKKEAITKLQNHISQYGKRKISNVSTRMMKYWWNIINDAIFDSWLSPPKFSTRSMRGAYAECEGNYYIKKDGSKDLEVIIHIDNTKTYTRESFIAVLSHEMVHHWQYEFREDVIFEKRMSHGSTFTQWRETLENEIGVTLDSTIDLDDVLVKWE